MVISLPVTFVVVDSGDAPAERSRASTSLLNVIHLVKLLLNFLSESLGS